MQTLIFQFKRFLLFLSDAFLFPIRKLRELWSDPARGRAFLFGLPAFLVAATAVIAAIVANSSHVRFLDNYEQRLAEAVDQKDWPTAQIYAQKVVQLQPDNDQAKWELANVLQQDDREDTKEASRKQAIALRLTLGPDDRPRFAKAHIWRAIEALNSRNTRVDLTQKLRVATLHLNHALAAEPQNIDAKYLMAERILVPTKRYEEALKIYIELFEKHVAYYVKIAELYVRLDRPGEAKPYLNQAIDRYDVLLADDPDNTTYLRRQANAHAMVGQHEQAIELLLDAVNDAEEESDRKLLEEALSKIYLANAMRFAREAENSEEDRTQFLNNVILAYQTDPESDAARTSLTRYGFSSFEDRGRALAIYDPRNIPDDAPDEALQVAGTQEVIRGDREFGIRLLEEAVQKNPRNHEALNNLAFTLYQNNNTEDAKRALKLANQALALQPKNFQYMDTRGNIYKQLEQYPQAIKDLGIAVRGMPNKLKAYEALAYCYEQQGMFTRAEDYRRKVAELGGDAPESSGLSESNTGLPTPNEQDENRVTPNTVKDPVKNN